MSRNYQLLEVPGLPMISAEISRYAAKISTSSDASEMARELGKAIISKRNDLTADDVAKVMLLDVFSNLPPFVWALQFAYYDKRESWEASDFEQQVVDRAMAHLESPEIQAIEPIYEASITYWIERWWETAAQTITV
jgi:hypothetical protein